MKIPPSTATAPPNSADGSSDEDSVKLIWQDDAGADLRSLFANDMISMTQQIDGWGSEDDSDTDDDYDGKDEKITTNAADDVMGMVDDTDSNKINTSEQIKHKQRKRSLPKSLKIGQNLTPPPSSTSDPTRALHSAETPATISKLRRKRSKNLGFVGDKSQSCNSNMRVIVSKPGKDETKQKISASQEVDRVFDFLGLPEHEQQSTQPTETSDLKSAVESARTSISPMPPGRLFHVAQNGRVAAVAVPNTSYAPKMQSSGQKLKLSPLCLDSDKKHIVNRNKTDDVEDLFKEIEMGLDRAKCLSQNDGAPIGSEESTNTPVAVTNVPNTDVLAEGITMHVNKPNNLVRTTIPDPVQDAGQKVLNSSTKSKNTFTRGVPGALLPIMGDRSSENNLGRCNISDASVNYNCKPSLTLTNHTNVPSAVSMRPGMIANKPAVLTASGATKQIQLCPTSNKCNDDEFGSDDDWNEDDLREIDQCIATSNTKVTENPLADNEFDTKDDDDLAVMDIPSLPISYRSSHVNDEFEDDDDDEFAALDLSGTLVQPNSQVMNSVENKFAVVAPAPVSNISSTNTSEFSDDEDFANMDFNAIDNKVAQHQMQQANQPSKHIPIHNRRNTHASNTLCFTRYIIRSIRENSGTNTKTLGVALWSIEEAKSQITDELECLSKYQEDKPDYNINSAASVQGYIHLRGIWYYTKSSPGDVIHLISISGQYATDATALPVVLDSVHDPNSDCDQDDLVLVIHPDELITPTLISEAVTCPRLPVLQHRLGSTGLSARSAVIGTLRHDLFERCLQEHTASPQYAAVFTRQIIRNNAESLVGCGIIDQKYAFSEVMKTLPQIQQFLKKYTSWDRSKVKQIRHGNNSNELTDLKGEFPSNNVLFSMKGIYSTEEMTLCAELGLKGYVDATIEAQIKPKSLSSSKHTTSLMPLELKTGHSQTLKSNHSAQLAVYTMLLRSRHGTSALSTTENIHGVGTTEVKAGKSGMLLYLNDKSFNATHIKPTLSDIKQLIGQRNDVACDSLNASRPRGITVEYNDHGRVRSDPESKRGGFKAIVNPRPSNAFPALNSKVSECERCYRSRECMMYASSSNDIQPGHHRLSRHFTSHLNEHDLDYFRKWDMLINLERHASLTENALKSWLVESREKESDGNCVSSLSLDNSSLMAQISSSNVLSNEDRATLHFFRTLDTDTVRPIGTLSVERGSYVLLSTDTTLLASSKRGHLNKMHILKGYVVEMGEQSIDVSVSKRDIVHVKRLHDLYPNMQLQFRLDKDEFSGGFGLLYQNLVNFLTLDIPSFSTESKGQTPSKIKSMTINTEDSRRRRRLQSCVTQLHPSPRFDSIVPSSFFKVSTFSVPVPGCEPDILKNEFNRLNPDQKDAIVKVLSAQDFALIQGLPGTGKTSTVSFLTRLLVSQGKRVLLTSYTHSAVDTLFCKLLDSGLTISGSIVRIGNESSCHSRVHSILAKNIACTAEGSASADQTIPVEKPNINFLHDTVSSAKVVGVTALTAPRSPLLSGQHFDYVIVDEAGQISQPAILGAMTSADKFILVGDHMQLPPLVRSQVAEQEGFGVSMLSHLAEGFPESVAKLTIQYRMHEDIQSLSNIIAYKGLLKCGNNKVRCGTLQLKHFPLPPCSPAVIAADKCWLDPSIDPKNPVVFINTDSLGKGLESLGPINQVESVTTEKLVIAFLAAGLKGSSIGIITPFRSQASQKYIDFYFLGR